jgi:hypothetical protein
MNEDGFGVCSHATRSTFEEGIRSAIAEACRAALHALRRSNWGDTLALKTRCEQKVDPIAHALYYAYHEPFPAWMFGSVRSLSETQEVWVTRLTEFTAIESRFSFNRVLETPVVGFAEHPEAFALDWGLTDPDRVTNSSGGQRLGLTSEAVNVRPHIVS